MNKKVIPALGFVLFVLGATGLFRFSQDVRTVDVIGLFASGMVCGAALVGIVFALKGKSQVIEKP